MTVWSSRIAEYGSTGYGCRVRVNRVWLPSKGQPGMVADPARRQLNRENGFPPCLRSRLRIFGLARQLRPSRPTPARSSPHPGGGGAARADIMTAAEAEEVRISLFTLLFLKTNNEPLDS